MIYISGPMSGIDEMNYPKFNRVAAGLRNAGHKVFNPAEVKIENFSNFTDEQLYEAYMKQDLKGLENCKRIYLLNNWHKSPGAKRELKRAIELDLEIIKEGEFVG